MGSGKKEYKTSLHAIRAIFQNEGIVGMYAGLVCHYGFSHLVHRLPDTVATFCQLKFDYMFTLMVVHCHTVMVIFSPIRLSAGLLRQATYTTTRMGMYTMLMEKFTKYVIMLVKRMASICILLCHYYLNGCKFALEQCQSDLQ